MPLRDGVPTGFRPDEWCATKSAGGSTRMFVRTRPGTSAEVNQHSAVPASGRFASQTSLRHSFRKPKKKKAASRRLSLAAGRSQRSNYFLTAEAAALAASTAAPAAALAESPAALAASTAAPAAEAAAAAAGAAAAAAPDAAATAPEAAAAAASAAGAAAGAGAGAAAGAGAGAGAGSSFLPQAARAAAAIRADRTSVLFMMNFL